MLLTLQFLMAWILQERLLRDFENLLLIYLEVEASK